MSKKSETQISMNKPVQTQGIKNYVAEITIGSITVNPSNLISFYIRETIFEFLPTLNMVLEDNGQFEVYNPLYCGQIVNVTITKTGESKKTVNNVPFSIIKVEKKSIGSNTGGMNVIEVDAIYDNVSLFSGLKSKSFGKVNFSEVIAEIGRNAGIPSSKLNISRSNDAMNWCCLNKTYTDFVRDSVKNSWISESDCPVCFVDFDGKLNYRGIYENTKSENRISMVFDSTGVFVPAAADSGAMQTGESHSNVVIPFYDYEFKDFSGYMNSMDGGFSTTLSWFSNENSMLEKETYDKIPKTNLSIYSNVNKDQNTGVTKHYSFSSDMFSIHKNYFKAAVKNSMILKRIFSESLVLFGSSVSDYQNFNLLSKVNVKIPNAYKNGEKALYESGDYLVGGIIIAMNKDVMNEVYICHRDGYNEGAVKGSMDGLVRI